MYLLNDEQSRYSCLTFYRSENQGSVIPNGMGLVTGDRLSSQRRSELQNRVVDS
jgi:hypothetical protein